MCSCGGSQQCLVPAVGAGWSCWVQLKKEAALERPHHSPGHHPSLHTAPSDVAQSLAKEWQVGNHSNFSFQAPKPPPPLSNHHCLLGEQCSGCRQTPCHPGTAGVPQEQKRVAVKLEQCLVSYNLSLRLQDL